MTPVLSGRFAQFDDGQLRASLVRRDHEHERSFDLSPQALAWSPSRPYLERRPPGGREPSFEHLGGSCAAERLVRPVLEVPAHVQLDLAPHRIERQRHADEPEVLAFQRVPEALDDGDGAVLSERAEARPDAVPITPAAVPVPELHALVGDDVARESGDFLADLQRWSDILVAAAGAPNGVAALASLVRYILEVVGAPPEEIRTFLTGLGPQVEEAYMTGAQVLIEQGRKEGEAKGRKEGEAKGEAKGRAQALLKQLERKFGSVPSATVERIQQASIEDLDRWALRVLDATTLDEVLAD